MILCWLCAAQRISYVTDTSTDNKLQLRYLLSVYTVLSFNFHLQISEFWASSTYSYPIFHLLTYLTLLCTSYAEHKMIICYIIVLWKWQNLPHIIFKNFLVSVLWLNWVDEKRLKNTSENSILLITKVNVVFDTREIDPWSA